MTARELFEGVLIEVIKEESPHFHLREFNHYVNQVINEWIDNQVLTFRVEQDQKVLDTIKSVKRYKKIEEFRPSLKRSFKFTLPDDYRHMSNVIVGIRVVKEIRDRCYPPSPSIIHFGAQLQSPNLEASLVRNYFLRPRFFAPKYSIIGNECEVFLGPDTGLVGSGAPVELVEVNIDYIKTPERIALTYDQVEQEGTDTSQELEFDEISCNHILKMVIRRVMERNMDQRYATHASLTTVQPTIPPTQPT
jgi:hypothetical protein